MVLGGFPIPTLVCWMLGLSPELRCDTSLEPQQYAKVTLYVAHKRAGHGPCYNSSIDVAPGDSGASTK
jgi:hypothetical protein